MILENCVEETRSDVHAIEDVQAESRSQIDAHVRAANTVAKAIETR